jgi:hypothetical protein
MDDVNRFNPFRKVVSLDKYLDTEPHYPAGVLYAHLAMKGLQLGSVVSILGVVPILRMVRKVPLAVGFQRYVPGVTLGAGVVTMLAPILMQLDQEGIDDRGRRLEFNEPQLTVDKYSVVGGGLGFTIGALARRGAIATGALGIVGSLGYYLAEKHGYVHMVTSQFKSKPDE